MDARLELMRIAVRNMKNAPGKHDQSEHGSWAAGYIKNNPLAANFKRDYTSPRSYQMFRQVDFVKDFDNGWQESEAMVKQISAQYGGLPEKEDVVFHDIAHELGYDALPEVVSPVEMDALIGQGNIELFRGCRPDANEQFRSADNYFIGTGVFGSGTYTAYNDNDGTMVRGIRETETTAQDFVTKYGADIMRMTLKQDASIITLEDLNNDMVSKFAPMREKLDSIREQAANGDEAARKEYNDMATFARTYSDPAAYAAMCGYDAIKITDQNFMVVLNRGKVIVQNAGYQNARSVAIA